VPPFQKTTFFHFFEQNKKSIDLKTFCFLILLGEHIYMLLESNLNSILEMSKSCSGDFTSLEMFVSVMVFFILISILVSIFYFIINQKYPILPPPGQ